MLDLFSVSVVIIRSLAILIIVNAITRIPAALVLLTAESYPDGSSPSRDYTVAVALLSYFLVAALLLIFAKKLGGLLTLGLANTSVQVDENNQRILQALAPFRCWARTFWSIRYPL